MTNNSHVEERIDHLVKELAAKSRMTSLGTNLSFLVGLISIAMLCVYFGYGYYVLNDLTQPETVVGAAKAYLEDNSPRVMEIAATEVRNSAPVWADQASQEFIASMPTVREQAEVALMSYIDEQLDETQKLTSEGFEDMRRRIPSIDRIRKAVDWTPSHSISEIIDDVVADVKSRMSGGAVEDTVSF